MNLNGTWTHASGITAPALTEGKPLEIPMAGKRVALLRKAGRIYAFPATCPHAGAPLCDGWLDARGHLVCPLHHYRFDPANGRNTSGEGYKLRTYAVELRGDDIFVLL